MAIIIKIISLLVLLIHLPVKGELAISMPGPRSDFDVSHDYHIQLLRIALVNAGLDLNSVAINQVADLPEGRAITELKKGALINLYWLGAERTLSEDLIPIAVPTTRGLIGFRKFLISSKNVEEFKKINFLYMLKSKVACQGKHWPDTKILQNAGLTVTTSIHYETLFKMLSLGRCDYFPRGYHDFTKELGLRSVLYSDLKGFDDIMLHYPFAIFFYVSKSEPELAKKLEFGLREAAKKGQIDELMRLHPLTKSVFPLQNGKPRYYFAIPNSTMDFADTEDSTYWIRPADFGITQ